MAHVGDQERNGNKKERPAMFWLFTGGPRWTHKDARRSRRGQCSNGNVALIYGGPDLSTRLSLFSLSLRALLLGETGV